MNTPRPQGVLIAQGAPLDEASLGRVWQHWTKTGFGILSANRGERTNDENEEWYARLRARVRRDGYGFIPVIGYWNETDARTGEVKKQREPSLFIPASHGIEKLRSDLIAWGLLDRALPQESLIFSPPGGPVEFINPRTGKTAFTLTSFQAGKVADIYSQLRRSLGKEAARTFVFEGWHFAQPPKSQGEAYLRKLDGEMFFVAE